MCILYFSGNIWSTSRCKLPWWYSIRWY